MAQRLERCLHEGPGEIVAVVKMPRTRGQTERPREPLLQVDTGRAWSLCSIAGRQRPGGASRRRANGEIPAWKHVRPHRSAHGPGPCSSGSLTGAVSSQSVTEERHGALGPVGNRATRAQTYKGA